MQDLPFAKFQGAGNDFIFIDAKYVENFAALPAMQTFVKNICDRHTGVGADGVVFYSFASTINILIINSDGSLAATCGNALRCLGLKLLQAKVWRGTKALPVFRYIPKLLKKVSAAEKFALGTKSFATLLSGKKTATGAEVTVTMAAPKQVTLTPMLESTLSAFGEEQQFLTPVFVQLLNSHWVFISKAFSKFTADDFVKFGKSAQTTWRKKTGSITPPASNIGMLTMQSKNAATWNLTVFERGAGLTQCCGSGAVAAGIALLHSGLVTKLPVRFKMPGGVVSVSKNSHAAWHLVGPAELVFTGTWSPAV